MGRLSFTLTSLVAAVPAGILSVLLVMAFLAHFEGIKQSMAALVLTSTTLAIGSFVVLIPFGILVFGGTKKKRAAPPKPGNKNDAVDDGAEAAVAAADLSDEDGDVLSTSGETMLVDSEDDLDAEMVSDEQLGDTTAFETPLSSPDIDELSDSGEIADVDMDDDFGLSDEVILAEDEEDEPPKKKKKR